METEFIKKLIEVIKEVTGLDFDQYTDKSREKNKVYARMIFSVQMFKDWNGISSTGRIINRDHATVLYYLKKYPDEVRYNKEFRELAERVEDRLAN